jgi:translation initiation factor IF-1
MKKVPSVIEAIATITAHHRDWVYHAEMPNGHRITAFVLGKHQSLFGKGLEPGHKVVVRMTTHDFSSGQVVRFAE